MNRFFIPVFLVFSIACGETSSDQKKTEPVTTQPVVSTENSTTTGHSDTGIKPGEYLEYYPGGALKIRGFHNQALQRDGLWISYYEEGNKWSESYYLDGKRDGHSITFYPNGQIRYVGEYKNDQKTGSWTFYDEQGNIIKEEKY